MRRRKAAKGSEYAHALTPEEGTSDFAVARKDYLEAVPIASALLVVRDDRFEISAGNSRFNGLVRMDSPSCVLDHFDLRGSVAAFLGGADQVREFPLQEGGIGGRHFEVRLARLRPTERHALRCLISMTDRTAVIETERSLRAEMLHDSLTGLPNRLAFDEAVEAAIAGEHIAPEGRFAVLVVDLARFSRVNECMGSMAGDELIITVARRLVSALRQGDVLSRLGGDEFGVLLRLSKGPDDAIAAAQRLQSALSTPFRLTDLEIRVGCAVGCALMTDAITQAEDLVRNAQLALKRAKRSGRAELYEPGEVAAARARFSLETELRRAIDAEQLTLAYQPLVSLETGSVTGFEALARWHHPERGPISPVEFIPVAEESGLITQLGRWALGDATRTLAEWDRRAGRVLPLSFSVNVSPVQFHRDDVVDAVARALEQSGISGSRLKLELTESSILEDPERAMRVLHALKEMNVPIAMDDFGTGYSSLAYLQKLPIDVLKIDRSFVTPMLADRDSVAIVRAVLSLADALGMNTTAEGVETVELAQTLAALGCTMAQGYYYGRPVPAEDAYRTWVEPMVSAT